MPANLQEKTITITIVARDRATGYEVETAFSIHVTKQKDQAYLEEEVNEDNTEYQNHGDGDALHVNQGGIPQDNAPPVATDKPAGHPAFSAQLAAAGHAWFEARQATFAATFGSAATLDRNVEA